MKVFAVILARGGSKGVPRKNVRLLAGKPLIAWTIEEALKTPEIDKVFVSTEDSEIAEVAEQFGAKVLHRPAELAQDDSLCPPIHQYHLREFEKDGDMPDVLVDLRPTSPLRTAKRISQGIQLLLAAGPDAVDSVRSLAPVEFHPFKSWKFLDDTNITPLVSEEYTGVKDVFDANRQSLPKAYRNNGAVHVVWPQVLLEQDSLSGSKIQGFVMEPWESVNIDSEMDFQTAEKFMTEHQKERIDSDEK